MTVPGVLIVRHDFAILSAPPGGSDLTIVLDEHGSEAEAAAFVIFGGDRREHSIGFGEGHVGDDREVVIADNVANVAADLSELGLIAAFRNVVLGLDEDKYRTSVG